MQLKNKNKNNQKDKLVLKWLRFQIDTKDLNNVLLKKKI